MRYWLFMMMALAAGTVQAQQGPLPPEAVAPVSPAAKTLPEVPVAPVTEEEASVPEEPASEERSYGTAPYSLMFTNDEIVAMKNVLSGVEAQVNRPATAAATGNQDILQFLTKTTITGEPLSYPVFYLSSILYNNPSDWVVWMEGGRRITPKNNKGALEVQAVTREAATFTWKPDYMSSLARRQAEKKFAPVDKLKNRLSTKETVVFNEKDRSISFTLRPNQSFSTAHMSTFEGKVSPVLLPPIDAIVPAASTSGDSKLDAAAKALLNDIISETPPTETAPAGSAVDERTVNTLQELLKSQQNFMAASPRSKPSGQQ